MNSKRFRSQPTRNMTTKKSKPIAKKKSAAKGRGSHGLWLVKQEPESYSWDDLTRDGRTDWTGVRNFQARNNLRQMKPGDRVLFYHSGTGKCRSEEHTSELQSPYDLVCRLLLEKKKKHK